MLPFGVTIPATVPQGSEIPEGLMNEPVYIYIHLPDEDLVDVEACRRNMSVKLLFLLTVQLVGSV
jgi:hypothetical protein